MKTTRSLQNSLKDTNRYLAGLFYEMGRNYPYDMAIHKFCDSCFIRLNTCWFFTEVNRNPFQFKYKLLNIYRNSVSNLMMFLTDIRLMYGLILSNLHRAMKNRVLSIGNYLFIDVKCIHYLQIYNNNIHKLLNINIK